MSKLKKKPKRKPKVKVDQKHDWVIARMPWSVGKPTYVFLLEVIPAPYDDVVRIGDTQGYVTKTDLYDFVANQLGPFFEKELPEGVLWRGRVFIAHVAPDGERNAKEDVSHASLNKRDDTGSSGSPDAAVRA